MNPAVLLRKVGGHLVACFRNGYGLASVASTRSAPSLTGIVGALVAFLLPILAVLAVVALSTLAAPVAGVALAIAPVALPADLQKKQGDLAKLMGELEAGQKLIAEGKVDQNQGEALDRKFVEAKSLQDEIDRYVRFAQFTAQGREVPEPILPSASEGKGGADEVVGYLSPGEAAVASAEYKNFIANGGAASGGVVLRIDRANLHAKGGAGLIPVTRKQLEQKAITVGAGVLRATRDPRISSLPAIDERLYIRDMVNVSQTDAPSVEYITETLTRGADMVAESGTKPEASIVYGVGNVPVRTIAVRTPVTEQMLQDVPNVQNTIDNRLTWDLRKKEEEQLLWGPGTGATLLGINAWPGVGALARIVGGDTLIDKVFRMTTDVRLAGGEPTTLVVHPLEWETMVLTKATTTEYVWAVITDAQGNSRVWGLAVVTTPAAQEPGAYATPARRIMVGDFRRGATIYDRQGVDVALGYVNDQFIKNERTIRVEERLAFAVNAPHFFRYVEAVARVP